MLKNVNPLNSINWIFETFLFPSRSKQSVRNTPFTIICRWHRRCERCRENTFHPVDFSSISFIAVFPKRIDWTRRANRDGVCVRVVNISPTANNTIRRLRVSRFPAVVALLLLCGLCEKTRKQQNPLGIRHCEIARYVLIGRRRR